MRTNVSAAGVGWLLSLRPVRRRLLCVGRLRDQPRALDVRPAHATGVVLPGRCPAARSSSFFLVVPFAAVLTLEAVRAVRGWDVGDGPAPHGREVDEP